MSKKTIFETLSVIDVSDKTEKKGKFTYLSWAFAWAEIKKVAPNVKVSVYENSEGLPYFSSEAGVMVKVGVTVDEIEHISYLPCMDFSNKAIPREKINMMDVNKAIQRATVKAIALHGLGLYIYAGEDLPEDSNGSIDRTETKKETKPKASSYRRKKVTKTEEEHDDI